MARMEGFQISNSDVLADVLPGNVYVFDDYKNHVGNSRFAVLVEMYHEAFQASYFQNNQEECNKIVQRIVDVTCHKNVNVLTNKGRFVVKPATVDDGIQDDMWKSLNDEESMEFVRQALREFNMEGVLDEEEELEPIPITSAIDFSHLDVPSIDLGNLELNDDSNKKRGRRQSLLRRSVSESTMQIDKKKLNRNHLCDVSLKDISPPPPMRRYHSNAVTSTIQPSASQGLSRSATVPTTTSTSEPERAIPRNLARNSAYSSGGTIVPEVRGMDVVLASDRRSLSAKPDIVGNNRLNVMLTLRKGRYISPNEKFQVAQDLVKTVTEHWGGSILVENLFVYDILTDSEAVDAFQSLLSVEDDSFTSFSQPNDVGSSANAGPSSLSASNKPLLLAAPRVPEFLRQASIDILNGAREDEKAGPEQMQSAARRSLQERKAKRQISKGLGSGRNLGNKS